MPFRTLLVQLLCLLLVLGPGFPRVARAATPAGAPGQGGAADLVRQAERAGGYAVKRARASEDRRLSPKSADAKPFWQALQKLNVAVDKAERGLFLKDETFFSSLADATSAVEEAKVGLERSGARAPEVEQALEKAGRAVMAARENYTPEGRRAKAGGKLQPDEKARLDQLKQKQKELDAKLAELEKRAKKNDAETRKAIAKVRKQAKKIRNSRNTAGDLFAAVAAASIISGIIWGWSWWWGPWWGGWWGVWCPTFIDITYIGIDDLDLDYDWDWVDDEIGIDDLDIAVPMDDAELAEQDEFLEAGDYELNDAELGELASEGGFEDVDLGAEDAVVDDIDVAAPPEDVAIEEPAVDFEPPAETFEPDYDAGGFDDGGFDDGGFDGDFGGFDDF